MPVSVVPHRAHVVASPQRRPLRLPTAMPIERRPPRRPNAHALLANRWRTGLIIAAPFGRPTATHYSVACSSGREVHFPYRCGTLRPTDRDVHRATAPFGTQTPAAGFAPPTRHARPLIFSPHATHRRQISSYKFLLSPSLFPVAAPIGPPLRAVGHRPAGIGAVCSSFLSAPRRRDSNGPFFSSSGSARSRRAARPPSGIRPRGAAPSAARRPFPHDLRRAVPGIPTVRRCPHPFTPFIPPIARAPRL